MLLTLSFFFFFFFDDPATTEIYTLSLHDALPISRLRQTRGRELRSELGITRGEVGRWRDLADLYDMADTCRPPGRNGATGAVFLLLQAERDSLAAVRDALKPPANLDDKPSLHDELLG